MDRVRRAVAAGVNWPGCVCSPLHTTLFLIPSFFFFFAFEIKFLPQNSFRFIEELRRWYRVPLCAEPLLFSR